MTEKKPFGVLLAGIVGAAVWTFFFLFFLFLKEGRGGGGEVKLVRWDPPRPRDLGESHSAATETTATDTMATDLPPSETAVSASALNAEERWEKIEHEITIPARGSAEWDVRSKPYIGWDSDTEFSVDVYYADQGGLPVRQPSNDSLRPTSVDKVVMFNPGSTPLVVRFRWSVRAESQDPRSTDMTIKEPTPATSTE